MQLFATVTSKIRFELFIFYLIYKFPNRKLNDNKEILNDIVFHVDKLMVISVKKTTIKFFTWFLCGFKTKNNDCIFNFWYILCSQGIDYGYNISMSVAYETHVITVYFTRFVSSIS